MNPFLRIIICKLILVPCLFHVLADETEKYVFNPDSEYRDEERAYIDSIGVDINSWIYDYDINYSDKLYKLNELQKTVSDKYGIKSYSYAFIIHKKAFKKVFECK